MDKLIRNIIIAVVIVLLLVAGYIAISVIPGQIEQKNQEELAAETGDIPIMTTSVEYVQSVTVTNSGGTYTLEKDDEGIWGIKEYPNMDFETIMIESAVIEYSTLYALEEVEMPAELSDYGFDAPRAQTKILLKDGNTREFVLGSSVAGGTGDFFMDAVNNKAYVVSRYMVGGMERTVTDYRKTKLASIMYTEIIKLDVTNSNGRMVMELLPSTYTSELVMKMTYPKNMDLDETLCDSVLQTIQDITVYEYIEDNPSDLSKYGLKNPALTVTMETTGASYTLKFGNKTADGTVYAMLDGTDYVFTHNANLYNACVNLTPYSMMNKFVNVVNISDVDSITIEGKGKKHILKISAGDSFSIDGKVANSDSFRKTYQSIIGIKGSGLAENNVSSPAEYTIEFVYKNGESTKYVYAAYDEQNYYVEANGERSFITLKKGLDDMMTVVEQLAKNPDKKIN